jgi:hypothetical protein
VKKIFVVGMLAFFACAKIFAGQIENGKTITSFAVEGVQNGYIRVAEPLVLPCKFGVLYYSGSGFLSILLAAKAADKKLSIIGYDIDANNVCTLYSVEIQ